MLSEWAEDDDVKKISKTKNNRRNYNFHNKTALCLKVVCISSDTKRQICFSWQLIVQIISAICDKYDYTNVPIKLTKFKNTEN